MWLKKKENAWRMIRKTQKGDDENVVTIKIKNKTENEKMKKKKN